MNRQNITTVSDRTQHGTAPEPGFEYSVPLSATPRGARLARLLATARLCTWGLAPDPARLLVAELAANAVTHGRVQGRNFLFGMSVTVAGALRIEVTDTRGAELPVPGRAADDPLADCGRGLLLVGELADRWGVRCGPVPRKTVWAEIDLPPVT
ncbi:ATP-binding protein [Streptomyces odontomachi]|uniref:ATP-binding protein n=1 Tax=Streptomyces odontomachi TaxID=2944940 RepID=UPI00210932DE|nr:ATP-binding protein [Streptomyces sp. ODS25]